jgi:hypothetical protein
MTSREGFSAYAITPPPPGALVRFWHELNGQVWTGRASELNPCFNVAYLWWKWTGIEYERLGERAA